MTTGQTRKHTGQARYCAKRVLSTLAIGLAAYGALYVAAGWVLIAHWTTPRAVHMLGFLVVSLIVGLFIGRRLPRLGWLYAALPVLLWTAITIVNMWHYRHYLWHGAEYQSALGVLAAMPGGWLGGRSARSRQMHVGSEPADQRQDLGGHRPEPES